MKKKELKPKMSVLAYLFEALVIIAMIIPAVLLGIYMDDQMMKKSDNILNKYDSITVKLPKQEKIIFFNEIPTSTFRDKDGILTVRF